MALSKQTEYFSLFGKIYLSKIDPVTGQPTGFKWLNDAATVSISNSVERVEGTESFSGKNATAFSFISQRNAEFSASLKVASPEVIQLALQAAKVSQMAATGLTKTLTTAAVGDFVVLGKVNVSNVVITDSDMTPLVEGVNYSLNPEHGSLELTNLTGFTAPYNITFNAGEALSYSAFSEGEVDYAVRFEGFNRITKSAVLLEIYKLRIDPAADVQLINEEAGSYEITGKILVDQSRPEDDQFYKQTVITK